MATKNENRENALKKMMALSKAVADVGKLKRTDDLEQDFVYATVEFLKEKANELLTMAGKWGQK